MTYVAILVTGTIATIGAVVLPKVLGFTSDPARRRAVLVAELVHSEFGVEHPVVGLQQPPDELGRRSRAWVDLLGGRSADIPRWVRLLDNGTNESVELDVQEPDILARLREVEHHEPPEDEDGRSYVGRITGR
jgi:hypothetical protein